MIFRPKIVTNHEKTKGAKGGFEPASLYMSQIEVNNG
jgi:hypothetical protein